MVNTAQDLDAATQVAPPELVHLATMRGSVGRPDVLKNTPSGTRAIFQVLEGRIDGDRLHGKLRAGANGDWLTTGPDGTSTLDVRMLIETDDGALIFMQYLGRVRDGILYSAPRFETGDDRYRWLNTVQAVAKGSSDGTTTSYELYEVR